MPTFDNFEGLTSVRTKINDAIIATEQNVIDIVSLESSVAIAISTSETAAAIAADAITRIDATNLRNFRPEDLGAVGDGVTDDKTAMAAWAATGGTLELTPGASYRFAAKLAMTFPTGTTVEGNGATIILDYTDTSNSQSIVANSKVTLRNIIFQFPENPSTPGFAHYQGRMLGLNTMSSLINCKFIAIVTQPVSADDIRDGCVRILGEDVVVDQCLFSGVYRCIQATPDASTARTRISNCTFTDYGKGIDTGSTMALGVIENLIFGDASTTALTDPGVNAITEGSENLTVRNIRVEGTGEHGLYFANEGYNSGLVLTDVQVFGSGQCSIKLRRQIDFVLADIHCWDTSQGNAPGTNEDILHFELCRNGKVFGVSGGEIIHNGGYRGIYLDLCSDVDFFDVLLQGTSSEFIYITDVNGPGDASPPTLGNLRFWGVRCFAPGAVPLLNIQTTGAVGPIRVDGVDYRNATGSVVVTNIGGAATDVFVKGNISTSGAMLTNTLGGTFVIIEAFWDRYAGGTLVRSYIDGRFTMYSGQFDLTDGDMTAFYTRSTGTAGAGAYIGGYGGSQINSGRPGWALVGKQGTADTDQVGAAILVHQASGTSDVLVEAVEFAYNLHAKFAATVKTASYTVATLPSASGIGSGARAMVSDANATTFYSIVAAGGANIVPVVSDGTNWRIG